MLKLILTPGARILSQLSIPKKFALIFILYLIPVSYIAQYVISRHLLAIEHTQNELTQSAAIYNFKPIWVNMAKTRGLMNSYLNGNKGVKAELESTQKKVVEHFSAISKSEQYQNFTDEQKKLFTSLIESWGQLNKQAVNMEKNALFNSYSSLIHRVEVLTKLMLETSSLLTDPVSHTSFLIKTFVNELPALAEATGKTRGLAAGVAANGSFNSESFIALTNRREVLSVLKQQISDSFASATKLNPKIKPFLTEHAKVDQKLTAFIQTLDSKLLKPDEIDISSEAVFSEGSSVIDTTLSLYDLTYKLIGEELQIRQAGIYKEILINAISSSLLVIAAIYLFGCFYANINDSLTRIKLCVKDVAAGDLTGGIDIQSKDEMQHIGRNINDMIKHMKTLVTEVHATTDKLVNTANNNLSAANITSEQINHQNIEVEQVATAMNEMSATVHEVASNAEQTAIATANVDRESKAGYSLLEGTIRSITELANELNGASTSINELQNNVNAIGSVLDVIQGIADQTNLLALNAAIEAARAGESGRGFAVVADEVRTLASKTQESTEEIRQMIQKLKSSANLSVNAMNIGNEKSQQTVVDARKAGQALKQISEAVGQISLMGEQIASASTEQSAVAEEINRSLIRVRDIALSTGQSASESARSSEYLNEITQNLDILISQFKV